MSRLFTLFTLAALSWPTSRPTHKKSQTETLPRETNACHRVRVRDLSLSDDSQGVGIPGMLDWFSRVADLQISRDKKQVWLYIGSRQLRLTLLTKFPNIKVQERVWRWWEGRTASHTCSISKVHSHQILSHTVALLCGEPQAAQRNLQQAIKHNTRDRNFQDRRLCFDVDSSQTQRAMWSKKVAVMRNACLLARSELHPCRKHHLSIYLSI